MIGGCCTLFIFSPNLFSIWPHFPNRSSFSVGPASSLLKLNLSSRLLHPSISSPALFTLALLLLLRHCRRRLPYFPCSVESESHRPFTSLAAVRSTLASGSCYPLTSSLPFLSSVWTRPLPSICLVPPCFFFCLFHLLTLISPLKCFDLTKHAANLSARL